MGSFAGAYPGGVRPPSLPSLLRRVPLADRLPGRGARVLLELDLGHGVAESPPGNPLEAMRSLHTPVLRTVVDHLRRAERDREVVGLIATLGGAELTMAQSGELRAAVASFRRAGKPAVAFAPSFGELTPGTTAYHTACAFEEVWLQPSGSLGLIGFAAEAMFLREALDKLGVEPQFGQRHEYKSAADTFLRSGMTEPVREMYARLLESATATVLADVAADRGLAPEAVRDAVAAAPLPAAEALRRGLVDRLGYRDEAYAALRGRVGEDATLRYVQRYGAGRLEALLGSRPGLPSGRPVVGVVHAVGPIHLGRSGGGPRVGGRSVGADTLAAALRAAGRDEHVKAVVLRVDSPGGSYVASDALRREILALRGLGKPVVASMASVAASGGYYLSMPCDRILASAGTLTGSIGVLAGKGVLRNGLRRLGVARETVAGSPRAAMFSTNRAFDDDELAVLEGWLDDVYADFTAKAAEDRGMEVEALRAVARGRVWTGADALERGLVDELGGLARAVGVATRLAGLEPGAVDARPFPKPNPLAGLLPPESSETAAASLGRAGGSGAVALLRLAEGPAPWAAALRELTALTGATHLGVLSLPPVSLPGLLPDH